jgi:hypothetical protein
LLHPLERAQATRGAKENRGDSNALVSQHALMRPTI